VAEGSEKVGFESRGGDEEIRLRVAWVKDMITKNKYPLKIPATEVQRNARDVLSL
jgi:hypothetical protein